MAASTEWPLSGQPAAIGDHAERSGNVVSQMCDEFPCGAVLFACIANV